MERIHVSRIEGADVYGHYVADCGEGYLGCDSDAHFFCSVDAAAVEAGGIYELDANHVVVREVA